MLKFNGYTVSVVNLENVIIWLTCITVTQSAFYVSKLGLIKERKFPSYFIVDFFFKSQKKSTFCVTFLHFFN